jgi:hypothetical protein
MHATTYTAEYSVEVIMKSVHVAHALPTEPCLMVGNYPADMTLFAGAGTLITPRSCQVINIMQQNNAESEPITTHNHYHVHYAQL